MEYIRIVNHKVEELVSADEAPDENWIEVSLDGGIHIGDDVRMFDTDWNLRPLGSLVEEGYIQMARAGDGEPLPSGTVLEKVEGDLIVPRTKYDFAKEGVIKLHPLEYLDDDLKEVFQAESVAHLLSLGKISQKKADEMQSSVVRDERNVKLLSVDNIVMNPLRWGSLTPEKQQMWAAYRQLLLDVPQQGGFPWNVTWPVSPEDES
jgi:hypothetical protein